LAAFNGFALRSKNKADRRRWKGQKYCQKSQSFSQTKRIQLDQSFKKYLALFPKYLTISGLKHAALGSHEARQIFADRTNACQTKL
jgi:hypothetical protein